MPNFIKSVERTQRYGDLTVFFKMAAVRHLGFVAPVGTSHDDHSTDLVGGVA